MLRHRREHNVPPGNVNFSQKLVLHRKPRQLCQLALEDHEEDSHTSPRAEDELWRLQVSWKWRAVQRGRVVLCPIFYRIN